MKFYSRRRMSPVITIVSLVDILTMVLMFFVYTTTFKTQQSQVVIKLPQAESAGDKAPPVAPAVLAIDTKGDVYLDDKLIQISDLGEAVKKLEGENRQLQMKADTDSHFGQVIKVLDALKLAGVKDVPAMMQGKK